MLARGSAELEIGRQRLAIWSGGQEQVLRRLTRKLSFPAPTTLLNLDWVQQCKLSTIDYGPNLAGVERSPNDNQSAEFRLNSANTIHLPSKQTCKKFNLLT